MKLALPTFSLRCVVPCRQLLHGHGTALNTLSLTLLFASAARARRSLLPARPRLSQPGRREAIRRLIGAGIAHATL